MPPVQTETPRDLPSALADVVAAFSAAGQPGATYRALDLAVKTLFGRVFLTVLRIEPDRLGRRIFTTDPDAYPTGERKPILRSERTLRVIEGAHPFIAVGPEEITRHYPGSAVVLRLGANSLGNFPVVFDGRVIGLVNVGAKDWTDHTTIATSLGQLARAIGPVMAACPDR